MSSTQPSNASASLAAKPALRGGLFALLAALLFGLSTPLIQHWGLGVGPFTTAALLYAGAALMLLGVWLDLSETHAHTHVHEPLAHEHAHAHDDGHHTHNHDPMPEGAHSHVHSHERMAHSHPHVPDLHHQHSHV